MIVEFNNNYNVLCPTVQSEAGIEQDEVLVTEPPMVHSSSAVDVGDEKAHHPSESGIYVESVEQNSQQRNFRRLLASQDNSSVFVETT